MSTEVESKSHRHVRRTTATRTAVLAAVGLGLAMAAVMGRAPGSTDGSPPANDSRSSALSTVCHCSPGNPTDCHTITVDPAALPAHLAHGDTIGPCPEGNAVDVMVRFVSTDDGIPSAINLSLQLDAETGEFEGSYEVRSAPDAQAFCRPWIGLIFWIIKEIIIIVLGDSPDSPAFSIYELSGFNFVTTGATMLAGGFMADNAQVTGTANVVNIIGVATGTTPQVGDSPLVAQVTVFSPAGPGRISFATESFHANGDLGITDGAVVLLGNPTAILPAEVTVELTVDLVEVDSDDSDGIVSGTYAGHAGVIDY